MKALHVAGWVLFTTGMVLGVYCFHLGHKSKVSANSSSAVNSHLLTEHVQDSLRVDSLGRALLLSKDSLRTQEKLVKMLNVREEKNQQVISTASHAALDSIAKSGGLEVVRDSGGRACFNDSDYRDLLELKANAGLRDSELTASATALRLCLDADKDDSTSSVINSHDALRFRVEATTLAPESDSLRAGWDAEKPRKYKWGGGGLVGGLVLALLLHLL